MSAGALHSDHINYLILRYLQESGHENAATALYRDWHRSRDHRDPESLPFAPVVGRHELISVIQEGLRHDELISRVAQEQRRFRWTTLSVSGELLENGTSGPRPSSSGKRKGRAAHLRASDEFPTPVAKRQRRSGGNESVHLNGDREAMDLDVTSPTTYTRDDAENGSPTLVSEPDALEPPPRYDSVAIQTDVQFRPKSSTIYWKVDKPGATVLHTAWNPDLDSKNSRTLLAVGESLCRFYDVPADMQSTTQIPHVDYPCLPADFIVTASAWHPSGRSATCAVDSIIQGPDGKEQSEQKIVDHSRDYGSATYGNGAKLLNSAGVILCLRYSPLGDYLLVVRTNMRRGSIQIWHTPQPDSDEYMLPKDPVAWRIFEHQILDACWVGQDSFLVCGEEGLSPLYRMNVDSTNVEALTAEGIIMQGIEEQRPSIVTLQETWDKIRFDQTLNLTVLLSSDARKLLFRSLAPEDAIDDKDIDRVINLPGRLSAAAFRPRISKPDPASDAADVVESSLLAVAFEEGQCIVYRFTRPQAGISECNELSTLTLTEGPALALSWSPDGGHLAVSGANLIQIWGEDGFAPSKSSNRVSEPIVTWRPDAIATSTAQNNGVNGETRHDLIEPSLSWSATGDSLAFAVDKQLAVIRFNPTLHSLKPDTPSKNGEVDDTGATET